MQISLFIHILLHSIIFDGDLVLDLLSSFHICIFGSRYFSVFSSLSDFQTDCACQSTTRRLLLIYKRCTICVYQIVVYIGLHLICFVFLRVVPLSISQLSHPKNPNSITFTSTFSDTVEQGSDLFNCFFVFFRFQTVIDGYYH